ncbi:DUF4186 family protein [Escherichia coli]
MSLNVLLRHYRLMTVSKPPCAGIRCLSLSTPPRPARRGCLAKWHNIPQGVSLSEEQQRYIVAVIYHWLVVQMNQP